MAAKIKVTQVKSAIKRLDNQKRTIEALGLRKIGHSKIHDDTKVIRGMVNTVSHLVTVEEVTGE